MKELLYLTLGVSILSANLSSALICAVRHVASPQHVRLPIVSANNSLASCFTLLIFIMMSP